FVNYSSSEALSAGIAKFNGMPLRKGHASRGLECRARRGDDLRAGVGGQRGVGMHSHWVRDRERDDESDSHSKSDKNTDKEACRKCQVWICRALGSLWADDSRTGGSNGHGSASTTSTMLARHFPQRFFILKSLARELLAAVSFHHPIHYPYYSASSSQENPDVSMQTGVWATQHQRGRPRPRLPHRHRCRAHL
ncbi:hypothetical protein B0H14DRAFT_2357214, partial [Mycena olivaceomarginata]